MTSTSTELPADPRVVKKMEKDIANEAKADEQDYQCALKELKRTEKSEAKASKAASKAERHLKKMEDKEHDVIKTLQEATHTHDKAVTDVHTAESGVQIQQRQAQRVRQNVDTLRAEIDEQFKVKEAREEECSRKLAHLHPPPAMR